MNVVQMRALRPAMNRTDALVKAFWSALVAGRTAEVQRLAGADFTLFGRPVGDWPQVVPRFQLQKDLSPRRVVTVELKALAAPQALLERLWGGFDTVGGRAQVCVLHLESKDGRRPSLGFLTESGAVTAIFDPLPLMRWVETETGMSA